MNHDYRDITDTMTKTLRELHTWVKEHGDGPASTCLDVIDPETKMCRCEVVPLWHDENGVPRFSPHHPNLCSDIYASEVALLRIACQSCEHEFLVQVSRGAWQDVREIAAHASWVHGPLRREIAETVSSIRELLDVITTLGGPLNEAAAPSVMAAHRSINAIESYLAARKVKPQTLAAMVEARTIDYGDPPNVWCCSAGPTMGSTTVAVVEFWRRNSDASWDRGWDRDPNHEVTFMPEPDDAGPP